MLFFQFGNIPHFSFYMQLLKFKSLKTQLRQAKQNTRFPKESVENVDMSKPFLA